MRSRTDFLLTWLILVWDFHLGYVQFCLTWRSICCNFFGAGFMFHIGQVVGLYVSAMFLYICQLCWLFTIYIFQALFCMLSIHYCRAKCIPCIHCAQQLRKCLLHYLCSSASTTILLYLCLCSCLYGVFPMGIVQYGRVVHLCSQPFDFTRLWMASKSGASLPLPYLDITMSAIYLRTTFLCLLFVFIFVFIFDSHFEKLITVESLMMTINMGTMFGCLVKESSLIKVKLGQQSENNPWELFG